MLKYQIYMSPESHYHVTILYLSMDNTVVQIEKDNSVLCHKNFYSIDRVLNIYPNFTIVLEFYFLDFLGAFLLFLFLIFWYS